jgi:hypothetical protein
MIKIEYLWFCKVLATPLLVGAIRWKSTGKEGELSQGLRLFVLLYPCHHTCNLPALRVYLLIKKSRMGPQSPSFFASVPSVHHLRSQLAAHIPSPHLIAIPSSCSTFSSEPVQTINLFRYLENQNNASFHLKPQFAGRSKLTLSQTPAYASSGDQGTIALNHSLTKFHHTTLTDKVLFQHSFRVPLTIIAPKHIPKRIYCTTKRNNKVAFRQAGYIHLIIRK